MNGIPRLSRCEIQDFAPRKSGIGEIDYANSAQLHLWVDELPDSSKLIYTRKDTEEASYFWAEDCGYVSFFYENPSNRQGYGGATFHLNLEDGTTYDLKGPWASRSGNMNHHFPDSLDVTFHLKGDELISGHCTLEFAILAAKHYFIPPTGLSEYIRLGFAKRIEMGDIVWDPILYKCADKISGGRLFVEI